MTAVVTPTATGSDTKESLSKRDLGAQWSCVDGNEAAASVAHRLSDVCAIYPITPASPMGELADVWSAKGKRNVWGQVPRIIEMQSEAGAAGTLHGAIQAGALGSTFTSSQGLLLMLPNMYKIAGELTPAVLHVAARAVATHALSIFGDHSDVMAARVTGWAILGANGVQEAHDMAAISHASTLEARLPFLHFFDGFRTSHEVNRIRILSDEQLRSLVSDEAVLAHRARAMQPNAPVLRGTAQNPDVFFQGREAANSYYDAVPGIVKAKMDQFFELTGRRYDLVEYYGAPDAERVIVIMGSGTDTVRSTVAHLTASGEKVGVLVVRLYRPFPAEEFVAALPETVKAVAVLDRVKEPGSQGEPLFLDTVTALADYRPGGPKVIGGRYGLGSKEFTPRDVAAVYNELNAVVAGESARRRFTVGIVDDVTHLSLSTDASFTLPTRARQAVFYGLGSDGTVGANKNSVKLIGEHTDLFAQGYFVYDSKKSGSTTVSHLRFGPDPIDDPFLIEQADFVAVHQFNLLSQLPVLDIAKPGATVLLAAPYSADELWEHLPAQVQSTIIAKALKVYTIDALTVARAAGLGKRVNTVMQACFFGLADVLPVDEALALAKDSAAKTYAKRGSAVVEANVAAIDSAIAALSKVKIGAAPAGDAVPVDVTQAADSVLATVKRLIAGEGELLPVSAMPPGGTFPTGTAKLEKRSLATELPKWDSSLCIDCGKCTLACPHAAIRMKTFSAESIAGAPSEFETKATMGRDFPEGTRLTIQVAPDDCTGCTVCVSVCPAKSKSDPTHKALDMVPAEDVRDAQRIGFDYYLSLPETDRTTVRTDTVKGSQLLEPLFEFSGACSGCGETPYLKLVSQLLGDRMVVANATGCSSIFGGNLPTTPWSKNAEGRGPAWNNSLFEDNAEFGMGLELGITERAAQARTLTGELAGALGLSDEFVAAVTADDILVTDEAAIAEQRARVAELKQALAAHADVPGVEVLSTIADALVPTSVWVVGGDGWAYDIGFGGLDHLFASGQNINVLVLDTEVYSNTGGQASKATPRGASAKFAASGKPGRKKDLGMIAHAYRDVYVAQIALNANEVQTVRAIQEAAAYPGPSLILAYATCIAHGIDLADTAEHMKEAVTSGHWPLYRYNPEPEAGAKPVFKLDSKAPSTTMADFYAKETRYKTVARSNPEGAAEMAVQAQEDADLRYKRYEWLSNEG
ncbi:MAG: pyruvate:ferredoxin (flavodoxin) oxidoreductase [Actinobacteria bacterium HGW-Actinobacteria-2]|nr:MAG: pyruvate:ferredoxin (flavodoxin) oxidoreductase [Actinobacteria bacterium HGW-Actinobacteria-2]